MVILVVAPEAEGEGLQRGCGKGCWEVGGLCFGAEFRKVEVLASGSRPVGGKDAGVSACGLSIKLDGQMVNGDGYVGVEEALHVKRTREKGGLG